MIDGSKLLRRAGPSRLQKQPETTYPTQKPTLSAAAIRERENQQDAVRTRPDPVQRTTSNDHETRQLTTERARKEPWQPSRNAPLPADTVGPNMRRIRNEVHHRLLGTGWCQRPAQLHCSFESICESCVRFTTDQTFQPVVLRQRDHAAANDQTQRTELFTELLDQIGREQ